MNERIKDLIKTKSNILFPGTDTVDCEISDIEKFAELIVKECAYLVNHQQRTTGYTTHAKMLCEEFGIEFKDEDFFGVGMSTEDKKNLIKELLGVNRD